MTSIIRREKIRLILGGEGTEPFKHPPPDGYRGIGEAIHDAVKERDTLLSEEKVLLDTHSLRNEEPSTTENKKYICDFSDGEHGHELFAWQHRYYGSGKIFSDAHHDMRCMHNDACASVVFLDDFSPSH